MLHSGVCSICYHFEITLDDDNMCALCADNYDQVNHLGQYEIEDDLTIPSFLDGGNPDDAQFEVCEYCGEMGRSCACYDICEDCGHILKDCWC